MLTLTYPMEKVSKDEQLLGTAKDCFNFVTNFFEVINISATHIYHSALELSPLPSIIRKLYYHQDLLLLPKFITGTPDSWDESITAFSNGHSYKSHTWSQCGHFVAAQKQDVVEIRDPLTLELLSTLKPIEPTLQLTGPLAYSPDGHSLACLSKTAIIIWDIQTHEVAKEIKYNNSGLGSLVWSLNGRTIGTLLKEGRSHAWVACIHVVASGRTLAPTILWPKDIPHFCQVHDKSFQIATTKWAEGCTIEIVDCEVGYPHTEVKSFPIQIWKEYPQIKSFSPTTHRISILVNGQLIILDIRDPKPLLNEMGSFESHCFSADGSLFAASLQMANIHVWKYSSSCYTLLKKVSCQGSYCLQFSPTSPSILGHSEKLLRVWRLDGPHTAPSPTTPDEHLTCLSYNGTHTATAVRHSEHPVTITNFLSPTPSQLIHTGLKISGLAITGNVLLVLGPGKVVAWLLTEEGVVDGVFGNREADHSDSIWEVRSQDLFQPTFSAKDQAGAIISQGTTLYTYHTGTGEELRDYCPPSHGSDHWQECCVDMLRGSHHLCHHHVHNDNNPSKDYWPVSQTLQEGWVKDSEGRHRLWLPVVWRFSLHDVGWCHNITTLHFKIGTELITIKF